ncbi:MAG: DUF2341 domain-containing protein [Candidatus Bathyarchaeia archaeon]
MLSLISIALIVEGFIGFLDVTRVFGQQNTLIIKLKWRASAGTGSTSIGPLAADLNNDGIMEIVITGMNGVAALNGTDGSIIWSLPSTFGGPHVPFEIVDLNKDNIPEILLGPEYNASYWGLVALHGNNGSIYWYNPKAAGQGHYIAVADINADGYPEIFSATPGKVTALTYDGRIFASTYTYYTCSGGMTIGDTDFDGVFEVYLGERSESYPTYPSGGRGLRAFWADNLTEIWCKPQILCSSQAPVLADVDNDGDLEIIIQHQRGGLGVFNTDGSVNTYMGKYRYNLTLGLSCHSNGPVADVDGDGNLEIITCGSASGNWDTPRIWDLVKWKLDATLPFKSMEPPGVADIDGDGKLEILVPTDQNVTILKYDKKEGKYKVIYTINDLPRAHPFFIAQDIDGDGGLELVFNQYNSWISVYDVNYINNNGQEAPVPAPTPLPRSGRYFYSEYRTRVPVYVPPPGPPAPKITEPSPKDGVTNVPITLSQLSFKLTDYQCDPINYTVTTNPNIGSASGTNVPNGKITLPVSGLAYATTYTWTVTATDGKHTTTKTFSFTTMPLAPWYNTDWRYRKTIVIDYTKVAADQTNFPVLIDLTDTDLKTRAQPDGDDIVFTDQNQVKLSHEIEQYDNATGRLIAWVKVPYLSSTTYTLLYMYYGNPDCDNLQNQTEIWDANYLAVLHLDEKTGLLYDSTANGNNGTPYGALTQGAAGAIGNCVEFNGGYIELPNVCKNEVQFTFSAWIYPKPGARYIISEWWSYQGAFLHVSGDGKAIELYVNDLTLSKPITLSEWYYVVGTFDGATARLYVNNYSPVSKASSNPLWPSQKMYIGDRSDHQRKFYGFIDEVRVSRIARDAAWILTEYNNQLKPTEFYTLCPEEISPEGENLVLTVFTVGNGTVIKNPDNETYIYGTLVQLTAIADVGYTFSHWDGDLTGNKNPTTILMNKNKKVVAVFNRIEHTLTVRASPEEGGFVKVNKTAPYYYGDIVELNAVPNAGWTFSYWMGDLTGSQNNVTLKVDGNKTVIAVFTQNKYILTVAVSGNGAVTIEPNKATYTYGENVTLTATADPDWMFAGWSGDISGNENQVTIMMDSNKSITAVFTQRPYTLTIIAIGNGTVNKNPNRNFYADGENVTLTAYPDAGWRFVEWSGDISGNKNSVVIVMDGNKTVYVTFIQEQYILTINIEGLGNVTKTPNQPKYTYGTRVQLTASAEIGWSFSHWSGDITNSCNPLTFTITGNMTITAHFTLKRYVINASVMGVGGSIEPSGWVTVYHGENITFTITPDIGYHIYDVLVDGVSQGQIYEYTFYVVTANHTITALFAPNEYTLTVNIYPQGSGTITLNNTGPYYYGDAVQLTAKSNAGWYFSHWEVDASGRQNPITIVIDGNKSIRAVFTQEVYTLNIIVIGNGFVVKEPNKTFYTNGETVTLTATAESGWTFSGWGGDVSGITNPITITMTENKTITATFTMNNWWCRDWRYRRKIVINHTQVSGTLTDFPVLIEILDSGLVGKTQPNGYDFVFTDANNVKLNHQIEFYDSTIGHLIVWVRVPYLSSTEDTILYVYYGNPSCEDQQNPTGVWDANHILVLHLNEKTGTLYDSTANGNNGTPYKGVLQGVTGKIDGAVTFDGNNDYIEIPHSDTLSGYTEAFTVSFWIKIGDTSRRQTILCKYNTAGNMRSWQIEYDPLNCPNNPFWFFASKDGITYSQWWASFVPQANTWYYVTIVWQSNEIPKFYINGVQVLTIGTAKISAIYNNVGTPLYIGESIYADRNFRGSLDEVHISNVARSASWILTAYNNQLNPVTFYSLGEEEIFQETYVIAVQVDGCGSVKITSEKTAYTRGENVTLTAIAAEGYEFRCWSGDITGTEKTITITVTKNMNITAHFQRKQYVINASVMGVGGSIEPSGWVTVYHGENITFTITPDIGYHIYDVLVDGASQGQIFEFTFYMVDGNHTIIVIFALDE